MITINIPEGATTQDILKLYPPPPKATHFRFSVDGKRPVIDWNKNLWSLAGCQGQLEYGRAKYQGRGSRAKIIDFQPITSSPNPQEASPSGESREEAPAKDSSQQQPAERPSRKPKIFGFSACAVAKALGAAGVSYKEAESIFRANGIQMPRASLSVQLGFGRRPDSWARHGKPAELSPEQLAELRGMAAA